jgi:glycosyltransferase involved in cell wall biosynthesis
VIAISEPVQEHLIRDFKVAKEHIEIIHNGIDLEKFRLQDPDSKRQAREKFGLKAGPVIGIIARLSDVKGHAYLIEAMKDVMQHLPTTRLVIAGEGKLKDELTGLIKRLGIEGSVLFLPNTSDTRQVLAALDVFVMPSLAEGLGLGLMEAMACGLAVIGSEVGGIRSLIIDKDNGLLVPPKDTKGLSRAMLELLRDDEKRALFGRRARDFIHRYFSLDEMVLKTEAAYVRCARRRSPRQ